MLDWTQIDTVFLDLDGTLLDLHFDNYFWLEHVPLRYAEKNNVSLATAKTELLSRYRAIAGTLKWYCVAHWSRELDLDIVQLKHEVAHLIAVHPHVTTFLQALTTLGKRRVLVTNAHQYSLALKLERTGLAGYFNRILSAHELGIAKEEAGFWSTVHAVEPFNLQRTLFIDDNLDVLNAARAFGFHQLLAVVKPDSTAPCRTAATFMAIENFAELLPLSIV
jgi:putative hydrolase of the HAD superfamily